jgi:hypothetical protein
VKDRRAYETAKKSVLNKFNCHPELVSGPDNLLMSLDSETSSE